MAPRSQSVVGLAITAFILITFTFGSAQTVANEGATQEMLALPIRVTDAEGKPVAGATVVPWALRCSQGHGLWCVEGFGESLPPTITTDVEGNATVPYPRFAVAKERIRTTQVTLSIDCPDFAYMRYEFIDVPLTADGSHVVKLVVGARVEIVPMQDGKPASLDGLYIGWSDARRSQPATTYAKSADGVLRLPPMTVGSGQVMLVRLDGEHATDFSPFADLNLEQGATVRQSLDLHPASQFRGTLSDNVPRPVKNGRLSAMTLPTNAKLEHVHWATWAPIAEDGTFVIDNWPADQTVQIIALCDGFMAESGAAPEVAEKPPIHDFFRRPQVFSPAAQREPLVLRMTPMVRCAIETVNEQGAPVPRVKVDSSPNVGWWNVGSQIYCAPLIKSEKWLLTHDHSASVENLYEVPFRTVTDDSGHGTMDLPVGSEDFSATQADFELPVVRGRRDHRVDVIAGETPTIQLVLQPKNTEYLGDWDKLGGVLFGCTGEQCRRLISDPGFRKKMDYVGDQLNAAKDPTDPAVLRRAYAEIGKAFDELDDQDEANIWRRKAEEQAAKLPPGQGVDEEH
jgi:hypothetical protein